MGGNLETFKDVACAQHPAAFLPVVDKIPIPLWFDGLSDRGEEGPIPEVYPVERS